MYFHALDSFPYMSNHPPPKSPLLLQHSTPFRTHPHSLGSQCASVCGSSPQHSVQSVAFIRGVSHLDKGGGVGGGVWDRFRAPSAPQEWLSRVCVARCLNSAPFGRDREGTVSGSWGETAMRNYAVGPAVLSTSCGKYEERYIFRLNNKYWRFREQNKTRINKEKTTHHLNLWKSYFIKMLLASK